MQAPPAPRPVVKKRPPDPPTARRSFDMSRPSSTAPEDSVCDGGASHGLRVQPRVPRGPESPPKPRPLSMQITPTDYNRAGKERSVLSRKSIDPRSANALGQDPGFTAPEMSTIDMSAATTSKQQQDVRNNVTARYSEAHLSDSPAKTVGSKQPPPAINRAAKPAQKFLDISSGTRGSGRSREIPNRLRSSPFSTPPGNEEGNEAAIDAPPIQVASQPHNILPRGVSAEGQPSAIRSGTPDVLLPPRISSRTPEVGAHSRSRSKSNIITSSDDSESRPSLPPRRQMSTADARLSHRVSGGLLSRQSLEVSQRPSALTQGFSASSFPPRNNTQSPKPLQHRPQNGSERRISMTPPPRGKPEAYFNKTFMKSSPVLTEPASVASSIVSSTVSASAQGVWPNSSRANRRPPCHREGPRTIITSPDTRLMDACGEYVCTSGATTRAWHVPSGKLVCTVDHPEGVKSTALVFKPVRDIEKEGQYVWLGTNYGEIMELKIPTSSVMAVNDRTHSRREVVKMFRKGAQIWTLDNEGKLIVWPSSPHEPNIEHGVLCGRASREVTASIIVGNKLFLASKRSVRVFQPNVDPNKITFEITKDPISVPGSGEITSSAHLPKDQDVIYFGHSDGKISAFSRKAHKFAEVMSAGLYKVSCLAGVGDCLWAGFSNGTIVLYDTKTRPWKTVKYWQPHTHPVISIVADKTSLWKVGRYHVFSLGVDSSIGVWDGMLEDDWIRKL